jgi:hypothetical protein
MKMRVVGFVSFISPVMHGRFMKLDFSSTAVSLNEADVQRARESLSALRGIGARLAPLLGALGRREAFCFA